MEFLRKSTTPGNAYAPAAPTYDRVAAQGGPSPYGLRATPIQRTEPTPEEQALKFGQRADNAIARAKSGHDGEAKRYFKKLKKAATEAILNGTVTYETDAWNDWLMDYAQANPSGEDAHYVQELMWLSTIPMLTHRIEPEHQELQAPTPIDLRTDFDKEVDAAHYEVTINNNAVEIKVNGTLLPNTIDPNAIRIDLVGDSYTSTAADHKAKYNWSGVVKLMKILDEKTSTFSYGQGPTDLEGNASDNSKIIPDAAIKTVILLQLQHRDKPNVPDTYPITGMPDGKFLRDILGVEGATNTAAEFAFMDQRATVGEDANTFEIEDYVAYQNGGGQDGDMYSDLRDLVLERNGLWSDNANVTNFVSLRNTTGSSNASVPWNDFFFVAYYTRTTDGEYAYTVKKYAGTTEPGSSSKGKILSDQTLTVSPGFVNQGNPPTITDPGFETLNFLRKANGSNTESFQQSYDAGMNVHRGNLVGAHRLTKSKFDFEAFNQVDNDTEFTAYKTIMRILFLLSKHDITSYDDVPAADFELQDDYGADLRELRDLFATFKSGDATADALKNEHLWKTTRNYLKDKNMDADDITYENAAVSTWSAGCQVPEESMDFFDMCDQMLQSTETTGQRRWYYTIIDTATLQIETQQGTQPEGGTQQGGQGQ